MRKVNMVWTFVVVGIISLVMAVEITYPAEKSKEMDIQRARKYENRKRAGIWGKRGPTYRLKAALPVDTDNDGMPDDWEDDHGLDKNNPDDAWWDPDGDKVINLFEYQLDSYPTDPATPPFVTVTSSGGLENALDSVTPGTNIWVAGGTYPINYLTFNTKVVMIQGGWSADFSQRDLNSYPTTLDGEMKDEILYFNCDSGEPVIILDGLHFARGAGFFGALNLLAKGSAFMRTSILNCSFAESTSTSFGAVVNMHNWDSSESDRTVASTLIAGNLASGIYSQNTKGAQSRWRILNTTISGNQNGGGYNGQGIDAFTLDTGVLDIQVYNSIIWGNEEEDINIRRNITCNSDYSDIGNVNAKYGAVYIPGPNNKKTDPDFMGGDNFHLNAGSECIDTGSNQRAPANDLDGNIRPNPATGKTDMGCYEYYAATTPTPVPEMGASTIDSGDYNGDGASDIAIFRAGSGLWAIRTLTRLYFGASGDLPRPGDYDGDGTTDVGIFRDTSGLWAIRGVTRIYFGSSADQAIPGDYDGDGCCDLGIFRDASGLWDLRNVTRAYFGTSGDTPVPGYYDGDGTKDIGIFRRSSGLWAIRGISRLYFGSSGDEAVPGDYNGDGTWEATIFHSASGLWAIRGVTRVYFGSASDQPVPADYSGNSTDDIGIFRETSGLWAVKGVTRAYYGTSGDIPVTR